MVLGLCVDFGTLLVDEVEEVVEVVEDVDVSSLSPAETLAGGAASANELM